MQRKIEQIMVKDNVLLWYSFRLPEACLCMCLCFGCYCREMCKWKCTTKTSLPQPASQVGRYKKPLALAAAKVVLAGDNARNMSGRG